ncbi:hypothetical protein RFI_09006 [Reticulomyxa filosa]|uniref:Uncharacterized protein n=1 Tax=Reticulomyxa filosa TaxID=46433 RepID=X6NQ25_RETFI|nr:hypothetical protein RFI_09006 [Reticulomyxa filosa]|eukprot:ETO28126.1 hypothetical protein RFI_09006 [Reticulomyxa filosa]
MPSTINTEKLSIEKIQSGHFSTYVNACYDKAIVEDRQAQSKDITILEFDKSVRQSPHIFSCDISWLVSIPSLAQLVIFARSIPSSELKSPESHRWTVDSVAKESKVLRLKVYPSEYVKECEHVKSLLPQEPLSVIWICLKFQKGNIDTAVQELWTFHEIKEQISLHYAPQLDALQEYRCFDRNINIYLFAKQMSAQEIITSWKVLKKSDIALFQ